MGDKIRIYARRLDSRTRVDARSGRLPTMPGRPNMPMHAINAREWREKGPKPDLEIAQTLHAIADAGEFAATPGTAVAVSLRQICRQLLRWRGREITVADAVALCIVDSALTPGPRQPAAWQLVLDRLDGPVPTHAGAPSISVTVSYAGDAPRWGADVAHVIEVSALAELAEPEP